METTRSRDWRMAQKQRNNTALLRFRREKNWKHLYLRSEKLLRAAQLGMEYPRKTRRQLAHQGMEELLSN